LPPIQRYGGAVIGEYVQERNLASRQNLAGNGAEQYLRVTATRQAGCTQTAVISV